MSFPNAAPQIRLLGTDDRSRRAAPRAVAVRPTHYPLAYFYAQRAFEGPRPMMNGDQAMYGADTFSPTSKYFNHVTPFITGFFNQGNAVMGECIIPADAAPPAGSRLCAEIIIGKVSDYERNSDGSIKLVGGAPVPTGTPIDNGVQVRYVIQTIPDDDITGYGKATVQPGTWVDTENPGVVSSILPLFDFRESAIGSNGNLTGFNLFAPSRRNTEVAYDPRTIARTRAYPLAFRLGRRASLTSTYQQSPTLSGARAVTSVVKPGALDPLTGFSIQMSDVLTQSYNRTNDSRLPDVFGFLGDAHVYQTNIDTLVTAMFEAEKEYVEANPIVAINYDFMLSGEDERYTMNFLGGTTFSGYPYHAVQVEESPTGYTPNPSQWVSFQGGFDGTMNDALFAEAVELKISEYANNYSPAQDDARRVESIFYDTGFPMETKYKLLDFIAIRKDLAIVLSVFQAGDIKLTAVEQYTRAAALRARAALYPDSIYFGTGVARVQICGRSGLVIGSNYIKRVPGTYEFAMKYAAFMGAGNRVWRTEKQPTGYPNSIVEYITDVDVNFTPVDQRVLDWDVGLNWIQNYDQTQQHIPAYKSVYGDDTSVLTSWFTVMGIVEINKVCQITHRKFSGVDYLTRGQLAERVDRAIAADLALVFGSRFMIEVETTYTDEDIARNYSWTTVVRIGAAGMKTVMTAYVEAYRIEDMQAGA